MEKIRIRDGKKPDPGYGVNIPETATLYKLSMKKMLKSYSYLDILVPTSRDNDGVVVVRGEPHAGHPVRVTILLQDLVKSEYASVCFYIKNRQKL
jgi:hypothetical protein